MSGLRRFKTASVRLTAEQLAASWMKIVFSWAPPLRAGKATHVIVMECVHPYTRDSRGRSGVSSLG